MMVSIQNRLFSLSNISKKKPKTNNKKTNSKCIITNASAGFSDGIKRNMDMSASMQQPDKKQCVIVSDGNREINIVLDSEKQKFTKPLSVSSVSGLTPITDNTATISTILCSQNYMQMVRSVNMEEKQNKKRIESFVKDYLFKNLKFISSQQMMIFSSQTNSLSYLICSALNIKENERPSYWGTYYQFVEKAINGARNDAVSAMKKSFIFSK